MGETLHVTPVMPVDEHHIEYTLDQARVPGALVTSWVPTPTEFALLRMVPAFRGLVRRDPVRLHRRSVRRHFLPDILHDLALRTRGPGSSVPAHDDFFTRVDRQGAAAVNDSTSAIIGREFGSLHSFRQGKKVGAKCIYHLPTSDHGRLKQILCSEHQRYGNICTSTFDPREFDPHRLAMKAEEIALADMILCPSQFVRSTLLAANVPISKIAVQPFGFEQGWLNLPRPPSSKKVVLVGNISARKGAHRLLEVWKEIGAHKTHQLILVGDMHLTPAFLKDYRGMYHHIPKMPREKLRHVYLGADILVLPALAEGLALVILEAVSCGVTLLASKNSGAEGFLKPDEQAVLFDAQDNMALAASLEWALTKPDQARALGERARQMASDWSWSSYRKQLGQLLKPLMSDTAGASS